MSENPRNTTASNRAVSSTISSACYIGGDGEFPLPMTSVSGVHAHSGEAKEKGVVYAF